MTEKFTSKYGMSAAKAVEVFQGKHDSKLKKVRVQKGLSQQGLANAAGVKKRLIQTYEQGERNINHGQIDSLCSICLALNCKLGDILEDEELISRLKNVGV